MINDWLTEDHRIHLPNLFVHLGYDCIQTERTHRIYKRKDRYYTVLLTEKGYLYYKVRRPGYKLRPSDLIIDHVSKDGGDNRESIWDRVDSFYQNVLDNENLLMDQSASSLEEEVVPDNFNHFSRYKKPFPKNPSDFYSDAHNFLPFKGSRMVGGKDTELLYPLYNLQNENCGYFMDDGNKVAPYMESAAKHSLWYSNIPDKIDWLVVFKDPKEALAFHKKFKLKNVVYLALGHTNYETTKILFQIQKTAKVKKIVLSFTGNKKIEGYLRDLSFISFMDEDNFQLTLKEDDILVRFKMGEDKSFLKFYNGAKGFNQGLAKSFLKYNNVPDQNRINQHSIHVSKDKDAITARVPLEVNAIKYFVWSYYKNYLSKTIDILKPVQANWYLEWEAAQSPTLKGKEVQLKDYRIAL